MPFDDAMMISTPALWSNLTQPVKRNGDSCSLENFGYVRQDLRGKAIPRVFTEVGVTFYYDSMDDLLAAGWIID
jgi:hypothetical protein